MMLPFCEIYLKGYNLIIENNFFQVGAQSSTTKRDPLSRIRHVFEVSFRMSFIAFLS